MNFKRFPYFWTELQRPFPVDERCYDCVEFYGGCQAWPAGKPFRCVDSFLLPPVGVNGRTGREFPPSQMQGRTMPRGLPESPAPEAPQTPRGKLTTDRRAGHARAPSPAARYGPDGGRLCECGTTLERRQRYCPICRQKRREATMQRPRSETACRGSLTLLQACLYLAGEGRSCGL